MKIQYKRLTGYFLLIIFFILMIFLKYQKKSKIDQTIVNSEIKSLGIIMDGNRRWAKKNAVSREDAYARGAKKFCETVEVCLEKNIPDLTVYVLSVDNFKKRTSKEIEEIYKAAELFLNLKKDWIIENDLRIEFVGDLDIFPENVKKDIDALVNLTKNNKKLFVHLLFGFGFEDDVMHAVKNIAQQYKENKIEFNDIQEDYFYNSLRSKNIPKIDLVIRTGEYIRLSGFVPLQASWSDFVFLNKLWPDITKEEIILIIENSSKTIRNFGA